MNRQQRYLLGMLKELHQICVDHDIQYFIQGGTLIGAVRNGGFLPWDDDADIFMTYDNWQRFKEVCRDSIPENRFLGSADIEESYGHLIPRYVSRDTTSIHACQSLHDDVAGEIIDVFVLDPVADGEEAYQAYIQDMHLYNAIVNYSNATGARYGVDPDRFEEYLTMMHEEGRLKTVARLEENLARHFDEHGSRYVLRWQGVPAIYQRSWFEESRLIAFEDTELMAPVAINEYLTCYFGEEWEEVPDNVNPSKHDTAASLDFPYTEALPYFKPTYPRDVLLQETEERRSLKYRLAPLENALLERTTRIKVAIAGKEIEKAYAARRDDIEQAVAQFDGPRLSGLLQYYIARQTSPEFVGRHSTQQMYRYIHPMLIKVPDVYFEGALIALLQTNRIRHVTRLLEVRTASGLSLTDTMRDIQRVVDAFNEAHNDYHHGAYEAGFSKARELLASSYVNDAAEFLRLACTLGAKLAYDLHMDEYRETCDSLLEHAREKYPEDGVLAKLYGDQLSCMGADDEARSWYLRAAESTRNGLVLRDITQQTGYYPRWMRKASWAKAAGITGWDGAEPVPLEKPRRGDGAHEDAVLADARIYLMNMVHEIADACENVGATYILGPELARALGKQGIAPDSLSAYRVFVRAADMGSLLESIAAAHDGNRCVRYMGISRDITDRVVRYCGTDSAYLVLKKPVSANDNLYVSIVPMEPEAYCDETMQRYDRWLEGEEPASKSRGIFGMFSRIAGKGQKAVESGAELYRDMMAEASTSTCAGVFEGGNFHPVENGFMSERKDLSHGGRALKVPVDLDAYLAAFPGSRSKDTFAMPVYAICSTMVSAAEIADSGLVSEGMYKKIKKLSKRKKRANEILKHFNLNYQQMKLAVDLKTVADELLPQKERIVKLHEDGDMRSLKALLNPYLKLIKKYQGVGDVCFDKEIEEIALSLM